MNYTFLDMFLAPDPDIPNVVTLNLRFQNEYPELKLYTPSGYPQVAGTWCFCLNVCLVSPEYYRLMQQSRSLMAGSHYP